MMNTKTSKKNSIKSILVALALLCLLVPILSVQQVQAASVPRTDILMIGDRDEHVTELQKELIRLGYLKTKATGYFGTDTQSAVLAFQKDHKMTEDGKAGPATRKILLGNSYKKLPSNRVVSGETSTDTTNTMRLKDRGENVSKLQKKLKDLGYYTYSKVTGYFGPITQDAVKAFQRNHKLSVDGIVGAQTENILYSNKAQKAPKATNNKKNSTSKKTQNTATSQVDKFVNYANAQLGKRYSWGGNGPNAFDCSGMVYYCLRYMGKSSPRTSSDMSRNGNWTKVEYGKLKKGDLVFFDTNSNGGVGHVGVYLGGGKFVHSSTSMGKVVVSTMSSGYYRTTFQWGRRVFED